MSKKTYSRRLAFIDDKVTVIAGILLFCLIIFNPSASGANRIAVDIVLVGETETADSIIIGLEYELRIYLENDTHLRAIQIGFEFWCNGGAVSNFISQENGFGDHQTLTVVPGSRMWTDNPYPENTVWDVAGIFLNEVYFDTSIPDSVMIGGVANLEGLPPGPLQHMLSLRFKATETAAEAYFCVDSTTIPSMGSNLWLDENYGSIVPLVDWEPGGLCLPIVYCSQDDDFDGVCDYTDNCPELANENQLDSDGDGHGDPCDNCPGITNGQQDDMDNDNIGDICDNCPAVANSDQFDSDYDSYGDACDNCPAVDNPDQVNSDSDSHGDLCDNCIQRSNESQGDADGDGIGDACEDNYCADANGDGTVDILDITHTIQYLYTDGPAPNCQ